MSLTLKRSLNLNFFSMLNSFAQYRSQGLWGNRPFFFFSGGAKEGAQWGICPPVHGIKKCLGLSCSPGHFKSPAGCNRNFHCLPWFDIKKFNALQIIKRLGRPKLCQISRVSETVTNLEENSAITLYWRPGKGCCNFTIAFN